MVASAKIIIPRKTLIRDKHLKQFFNTEKTEKIFIYKEKKIKEVVAKYPKIIFGKHLVHYLSLSSDAAFLYPNNKKSIFSLRIDIDDINDLIFKKYVKLLEPFNKWVTIFCCASKFLGREFLLKELHKMGIDIQSHGFYHHSYRDYKNNFHNIAKAKILFEKQNITTCGFSAPMGTYNKLLMLALENLEYKYSSDFSFDYINFPHYPFIGNRFSKILQIPIFPICPELLFNEGCILKEVIEYYKNVVLSLKSARIPVIIYLHTDSRYPEVTFFLKELLDLIKNDQELYKCSLSKFAEWCFEIENTELSKKYGIITSGISRLNIPPSEYLGIPSHLGVKKRIKRYIKELIDYEEVTPVEELKNNWFQKSAKMLVRHIRNL